ncbi:MAG: hypothetical protein GXP39_13770 [Chloroflexi bacterium]|nr:hypothetical protein [Chloroflexota bacterium]
MNLKLKRLVRTPYSEQYALFDLDRLDASLEPMSVGKLDLHFTAEGMYGTLLLWRDVAEHIPAAQRRALVEALLSEVSQPMGVPESYAVEFFTPTLAEYELLHNIPEEDELEQVGG